ncbi:MAG: CcmD family protein [Balneolaceae bacterium]|nr:CcmD family protein [Balneolaceae bacterium]
MQEDTLATVDTLTQTYSDKWSGTTGVEEANAFVQLMSSNELIYVVLGVTLIIWFVLLFFLFRVDQKVSRLEEEIKSQ